MYVCLHLITSKPSDELLQLGLQFSPEIEWDRPDTIVFSIAPLRMLLGTPHQIASEICRYGYERHLYANLAIASNPDAAVLLASHLPGVTLTTPGEEKFKIAPLPLAALFAHPNADLELLHVLFRWGIKTCGELAQLPELGVSERLGQPGLQLRKLALGVTDRPLRLSSLPINYKEIVKLEYPVDSLEPLLFLLGRALSDLCRQLRQQSKAARSLKASFSLETGQYHHCHLEFPVSLDDSKTLLKLLQLHLERYSLPAPALYFTLEIEPAEKKRQQEDFFLPPTPAPDQLQITLARIASLVGSEHVGSPRLLATHRPDAFELAPLDLSSAKNKTFTQSSLEDSKSVLRLNMRIFRPALQARVRLAGLTPQVVAAPGVKGVVLRSAGPWKTSGEWWAETAWIHEEWDVALDDGALYRIYLDDTSSLWFVQGVYD